MTPTRLLACLAIAATMAACTILPSGTPAKLYTLTPATTFDGALPKADWQLLAELPTATAALDTPRVAAIRAQTAVEYFADVTWTDRAPAMVQGLIVESFENSGKIVSVARDNVGLRVDLLLKTDLRDFQAEYSAPNAGFPDRVRVRVAARLVAMPRRTIEASESFEAIVPITPGKGFPAVVEAFDAALGKVMTRLVEWTLRNGNTALTRPERPPARS